MKLLWLISAVLAISLANDIADSENEEAAANIELFRSLHDETFAQAASSFDYQKNYIPPSQRPPKPWTPQQQNNQNYIPPQNNYIPPANPPQNTWTPPQNNYNPPQNSYNPPQNTVNPPQNTYVPPQNDYIPPQNTWTPPQNTVNPPQNTWTPPQNTAYPPQNSWSPPQNTVNPPQNTWSPPQNTVNPPQNTWIPPQNTVNPPQNTWIPPAAPTTTTPSSIIKNEQTYGDDGSYKYEYQIADGTHVAEEGYFTNPKANEESLVKKGYYSYPGPDGKVYTVTYWADHTGFHAFGDHLPTPPPVPAAIQAALDQNAKEEAAKAEAEKNKPQVLPAQPTYPQQTYYPQQQNNYPQQQNYYPQQQNNYPEQQNYYPQQQTPAFVG